MPEQSNEIDARQLIGWRQAKKLKELPSRQRA